MKFEPHGVSTGAIPSTKQQLPLPKGLAMAICVAAAWSAQPAFAQDAYCTLTSTAANWACLAELRDDFWINVGNCVNTDDAADRGECWDEARADRADTMEECGDQLDARLDVCDLIGEDRYDPDYEPEDFVNPADIGGAVEPNPFMPLIRGSKWVYANEEETVTVEVMDETIFIDGVECVVVRDVVEENSEEEAGGEVVEDTDDYFAQDNDGNIWYFGEISLNFEDGELVDIEGSWKTGEEGGKAGILMPAIPMGPEVAVGDVFRQEFLLGDAEDMGKILDFAALPDLGEDNVGDCSGGCVQFEEWTPIEPDSIEYKFYQAGVGMVQELDPESGETLELVEFTTP